MPGGKVRKLSFDIREQAAGANAEKRVVQPIVTYLFLHQNQPIERFFGAAYTTCRFEADFIAVR